jgi:hypothetical protein
MALFQRKCAVEATTPLSLSGQDKHRSGILSQSTDAELIEANGS